MVNTSIRYIFDFLTFIFDMKKLLLVFAFLTTFTAWAADYRSCEITYEDGRTETVEVQFPFANDNPNLRIKRNGKRASIDKDLIKFFTLSLNDGENDYLFLGGRRPSYKGKKQRKIFTLVTDVHETGIIVGNLGLSYDIKRDRKKDKDIIVFTYMKLYYTNTFSRINEDTFYVYFITDSRRGRAKHCRKIAESLQEKLLLDCTDIVDHLDLEGEIKKEEVYAIILEAYKKCLNQ